MDGTCGNVDVSGFDRLRKQPVFVFQTGRSWGCILCVQGALQSAIGLCNFRSFPVVWGEAGSHMAASLPRGVQRPLQASAVFKPTACSWQPKNVEDYLFLFCLFFLT